MNANIDFKNIWHQQEVAPPNIEEVLSKIRKFKKAGLRQLLVINVFLIITAALITFIWIYFQPKLISTKIGIVMVILAMFIFIMAYNQLFKFYKASSGAKSNSEYLKDFIILKRKQKFLQTTMMQLYFMLLSLGIGLYLFEYVRLMPLIWGILTYVLTFAWLAFNWFYLRPKIIKKQQAELESYIVTLERITQQLET